MQLKGFDELIKKLEKMANAAKKLDGKHEVRLEDIFHPIFMLENTSFGSMQEFFDASPVKISTQEDFENIDDAMLDSYVREKTRFQSWSEMRESAAREWMVKRFEEESK